MLGAKNADVGKMRSVLVRVHGIKQTSREG